MPALAISRGLDANKRPAHARGWIAIGPRATGVVAIGGKPTGIGASGGIAIGVFAAGGMTLGVFTIGGIAIGLLTAIGGCAASLGFGFGGIAIGVGLLMYGSQILRAIGVKLAVITPSRGFCIEMGSSLVVIIGAHMGLPLSTTHCQVGATMGVALLEGARGFNKWVLFKTAFGWVFTCFFVGFLSACIFSFGAYAPMASKPVCWNGTLTDQDLVPSA